MKHKHTILILQTVMFLLIHHYLWHFFYCELSEWKISSWYFWTAFLISTFYCIFTALFYTHFFFIVFVICFVCPSFWLWMEKIRISLYQVQTSIKIFNRMSVVTVRSNIICEQFFTVFLLLYPYSDLLSFLNNNF